MNTVIHIGQDTQIGASNMQAKMTRNAGGLAALFIALAMVMTLFSPSVAGAVEPSTPAHSSSLKGAALQSALNRDAVPAKVLTTCGAALPTGKYTGKAPKSLPKGPSAPPVLNKTGQPVGKNGCNSDLKSVRPEVGVSFGWYIYVHFTHADVEGVMLDTLGNGSFAAVAWACSRIPDPYIAGACAVLAAIYYGFIQYWFSQAAQRGGGLLLDFTYIGSFYTWTYVSNSWPN